MRSGRFYKIGKIRENASSVRLVCFGILPGKVIRIIRRSPFGGTYYISCDDKRLAISKEELKHLELVEVSMDENLIS